MIKCVTMVQEAVERNKDDLLGQIPEGGHVTVLVFRDGDDINLYHVLERPDGSYSPLSDSWSGSSIRYKSIFKKLTN